MTDYLTAAEWEAWLTPQDAVEKLLPKLNHPGIVTMPLDFDEVQLTEEEQQIALFDARCIKYWDWKTEQEQEQ